MASPGPAHTSLLEEEFTRLAPRGRRYLTLAELLEFRPKGAGLPVDLCHLGVLWVLDADHDGRVTLAELAALAALCARRAPCYQPFELAAQLQGFCALRLWRALAAPGGADRIAAWAVALLAEAAPARRRFWRYGAQPYLSTDAVALLHRLLRVHELHGAPLQAFFDLLQRAGEERGAMDLRDAEQDAWVPLAVVRDFAAGAARGAARLMADICPAEELPEDLERL